MYSIMHTKKNTEPNNDRNKYTICDIIALSGYLQRNLDALKERDRLKLPLYLDTENP